MSVLDTIAAVSTPRGKGGVALLRISGSEARAVLETVFSAAQKAENSPRTATFGKIIEADGTVLDEGLATFFEAPRSFTGEDVAELSCHGGVLLQ